MKLAAILLCMCVLFTGCQTGDASSQSASASESSSQVVSEISSAVTPDSSSSSALVAQVSGKKSDWNLILVNKDHPISADYTIPLTSLNSSNKIDSRIEKYYNQMFSDAKNDGFNLHLRSSYRTFAIQKIYYDSLYNSYINAGFSAEQAASRTEELIAPPGCSEHHTGLAVDIISEEWQNSVGTLSADFDNTDCAKWLRENAHKYGFILRYMKDKVAITKYSFEPWHFRYVGIEAATYMKEHNLCLEEYIELLKN